MRQSTPPASSLDRPLGTPQQDCISSPSPSQDNHHHHHHHDVDVPSEPSSSSSSASQSANTPMTHHGSHYWSDSASPHYIADVEDDGSDDHEMADIEQDAHLSTYTHEGGIISPFPGGIMNTPFVDTHHGQDEEGVNEAISLDPEYPPPPPLAVAFNSPTTDASYFETTTTPLATLAPAPAHSFPQLPALAPAPAHNFPQLPAFTQQILATVQPQHVQLHLQQQLQLLNAADVELDDEFVGLHPVAMSNPNPMSLGPENPGVLAFLRAWARVGRSLNGQSTPRMDRIQAQFNNTNIMRVEYAQLKGDKYDFQGIDWEDLGVTRKKARERRHATYSNYVNKRDSDKWHPALPDRIPSSGQNLFRFTSMDIRRDTRLLHFQLRNTLACSSRTRAFYPSYGSVRELDPTTGRTKKAMNFASEGDVQISTLDANEEVLVAGGFLGDYRFRHVDSEDRSYTEGRLTENVSGITNHVQVHPARRSNAPMAAFASNDFGFRTVDLTTNKIMSRRMYDYPLNCSAISTDRRLRVMVGDHTNVLITDAESGEILQNLSGHRDFGFACDWAPDGWTVATGFQDKSVRIWDARKWTSNNTGEGCPVEVLRMDMSGARSLRFSPLGSGRRVLVAAEEADVINIIDAQTFTKKQKVEVLGEIGGIAFADEGQRLTALVCDRSRGGVLQLERCDAGAEDAFEFTDRGGDRRYRPWWRSTGYDWLQDPAKVVERPESQDTLTQRRRKAATIGNLDPF